MQITDFHAKYYAHALTRRYAADDPNKLTSTLGDAQVDLNPHQIEAALFAFKSPFSKGCILADEVGLGKTIEAGIVLAQKWAEGKRRILVITPSSLRMQWQQELLDKFFLPSQLLESSNFNKLQREGQANPFLQAEIVICSFHFAKAKADLIAEVSWDLVTIDEAHRLRNLYKKDNKIGRAIQEATQKAPKILLTATPLQNSLLELFGLVSLIDEHAFGDLASFKAQYCQSDALLGQLRARLRPYCKRTLRRQVLEYIRYTNRIPLTQEFTPTRPERELYDRITQYLHNETLYALPSSQRQLITLVLRKLLASSSHAIAATLESLIKRLQRSLHRYERNLGPPYSGMHIREEAMPFLNEAEEAIDQLDHLDAPPTETERSHRQAELAELQSYLVLATGIESNAKAGALLTALDQAFAKTRALGSAKKALIFTESRRTQQFLFQFLSNQGFGGKIVLFNGQNTAPEAQEIYEHWKNQHQGSDRLTGLKNADMRSALVDHFRNQAEIMIATEAAAEGINLQFCSLIVNYDLPWNPQRIEQRIGRCHRYGQRHDVVVVNFLDKTNEADQRVFQLLSEKFQLFEGVFGASDGVLGAIESGVDFEQRIAAIYQQCRTDQEIQQAFDALQQELQSEIGQEVKKAHTALLENFDEDVTRRVKLEDQKTALDEQGKQLLALARHLLPAQAAAFGEAGFALHAWPFSPPAPPMGNYKLGRDAETAHLLRPHSQLGLALVTQAMGQALPPGWVRFDYSHSGKKITLLEPWVGKQGVLALDWLSVDAAEGEDIPLIAAMDDQGNPIPPDLALRLFSLPGSQTGGLQGQDLAGWEPELANRLDQAKTAALAQISQRNGQYFDQELTKLETWAEDLKTGLEWEIKNLDKEIKLRKNEARTLLNLEAKVAAQREIKEQEQQRNQLRMRLFSAQDEVDCQKEALLNELEARLAQQVRCQRMLVCGWKII